MCDIRCNYHHLSIFQAQQLRFFQEVFFVFSKYEYIRKFNDKYIIYDAKDLKDNELGNNNEIIVKNVKAEAIWLTDKATDEEVKAWMSLPEPYEPQEGASR